MSKNKIHTTAIRICRIACLILAISLPLFSFSQRIKQDSLKKLVEKHAKACAEENAVRAVRGLPEKSCDTLKIGDSILVFHSVPIIMTPPEYPGGHHKMLDDVYKNLPKPNKQVKGTVSVRIYVDDNGKVQDAAILKGLNSEYDQAVYLSILKLSKFKSAIDTKGNATPGFIHANIFFK